MPETIIHSIAPIYDAHSKVLLLGTVPSPKSRETGFFYGHPQNRFWRVMQTVLGESAVETISQKRRMLLENGVALWDVLHACTIEGASDASIRDAVPNDLGMIFNTAKIKAVFTTGTKAGALYKRYQQPLTGIPAVTLPSTSPANCAWSFDALVEKYSQILSYIKCETGLADAGIGKPDSGEDFYEKDC